MSQIKIYAQHQLINEKRDLLSQSIHAALVTSLNYPEQKCFQRFIALDEDDFIYPSDRSSDYLIIEISMFEGRTKAAKKLLIKSLFSQINQRCAIDPQDIEITIFETPKENWGIRGLPADELKLNYKVNV